MRRDSGIDALRGAVTVLVVAHHAALAYCTFSRYDPAHYAWSTAPVVDAARWVPLDYLVAWNDLWFMAMLFLLSGLFVPMSLRRKGASHFLKDRARRLGIPFAVAVVVLMPLAYYPSWRLGAAAGDAFLPRFFTVDGWPVGPPWFLWVLLAFCALAASAWPALRHLGARWNRRPRSPAAFAGLLVATAVVATVLPRLWIDPAAWGSLGGPFDVQIARVPLYAAYFVLGIVLGDTREARDPPDAHPLPAALLRGWPWWAAIAAATFCAHWRMSGMALAAEFGATAATLTLGVVFGVCCAASCLAALGLARAAFASPSPRDASSVGASSAVVSSVGAFSASAYGVYVLHYPVVVWMQYALLGSSLPAAAKFAIVFVVGLGASWAATAALRRTPVRAVL